MQQLFQSDPVAVGFNLDLAEYRRQRHFDWYRAIERPELVALAGEPPVGVFGTLILQTLYRRRPWPVSEIGPRCGFRRHLVLTPQRAWRDLIGRQYLGHAVRYSYEDARRYGQLDDGRVLGDWLEPEVQLEIRRVS